MTWPGRPTDWRGKLTITASVDEDCQANHVVDRDGRLCGVWLDDTTPGLASWVALAVAKYQPQGLAVFVCVPPGQAGLHHHPSPPVVNLFEAYPYGEGVPPAEFFPLPKYEGYVVQHSWPGAVGTRSPTLRQRLSLLTRVLAKRPRYVFLF